MIKVHETQNHFDSVAGAKGQKDACLVIEMNKDKVFDPILVSYQRTHPELYRALNELETEADSHYLEVDDLKVLVIFSQVGIGHRHDIFLNEWKAFMAKHREHGIVQYHHVPDAVIKLAVRWSAWFDFICQAFHHEVDDFDRYQEQRLADVVDLTGSLEDHTTNEVSSASLDASLNASGGSQIATDRYTMVNPRDVSQCRSGTLLDALASVFTSRAKPACGASLSEALLARPLDALGVTQSHLGASKRYPERFVYESRTYDAAFGQQGLETAHFTYHVYVPSCLRPLAPKAIAYGEVMFFKGAFIFSPYYPAPTQMEGKVYPNLISYLARRERIDRSLWIQDMVDWWLTRIEEGDEALYQNLKSFAPREYNLVSIDFDYQDPFQGDNWLGSGIKGFDEISLKGTPTKLGSNLLGRALLTIRAQLFRYRY